VAGNFSLSGSITVTLTPGSRLDVDECLNLSDGAKVEVLVTETTLNRTVVVSFSSSCSTVPPVEVISSLDKCQYGEASTQVVPDSSSRTRLEIVFSAPSSDSGCKNGTDNINGGLNSGQIIGIAVASAVVGLVIIAVLIAFLVPPIRRKIFPYSQRRKSGLETDSASAGTGQNLPEIETMDDDPVKGNKDDWKSSKSPRTERRGK
jgi:hypothetical protein